MPTRPRTANPSTKPGPNRLLPVALAAATATSGALLLLGALGRAGKLPLPDSIWTGWVAAPGVVRFAVILLLLGGLLAAGPIALRMTWRNERRVNLLACIGYLAAVGALLVGATANPQYGASEAVPLLLSIILGVGTLGVFYELWRRTPKTVPAQAEAASPEVLPEAPAQPKAHATTK